jgi:hypothetical protein
VRQFKLLSYLYMVGYIPPSSRLHSLNVPNHPSAAPARRHRINVRA